MKTINRYGKNYEKVLEVIGGIGGVGGACCVGSVLVPFAQLNKRGIFRTFSFIGAYVFTVYGTLVAGKIAKDVADTLVEGYNLIADGVNGKKEESPKENTEEKVEEIEENAEEHAFCKKGEVIDIPRCFEYFVDHGVFDLPTEHEARSTVENVVDYIEVNDHLSLADYAFIFGKNDSTEHMSFEAVEASYTIGWRKGSAIRISIYRIGEDNWRIEMPMPKYLGRNEYVVSDTETLEEI